MKTFNKLGKLAPFVIKVLGAGSMATVAAAIPSLLTASPEGAIITGIAVPVVQTFASVFANLTYDQLKALIRRKDYGFNGDLQKVYNEALKLALSELKKKYLREHSEANHEHVNTFFEHLQNGYPQIKDDSDDVSMHEILDTYVLHAEDKFLVKLKEILQLNESTPEGKLLDFLVERFPAEMELAFLAQMKEPEYERARISFMIYLGEESLRLGKANQDELAQVFQLLQYIVKRQDIYGYHQEEAVRVLQLTSDKLRKMGYDLKRLEGKMDKIAQQTAPKLPLYLPKIDLKNDRDHMLQFKAAFTTFIGREKEIQQLYEFVRVDQEPFRWLLVTGPGGIGKSRLALEYCNQLRREGFGAGFIMANDLAKLQDYQPEKPALIVIDYVASWAKEVKNAVLSLYHRQTTDIPLQKPIRLLLLERDTNGNWWKDFKDNAEVWTCRYRPGEKEQPILQLSSFNETDRWQIVSEVYQKIKKEHIPYDRKEVLAQLYRLDPIERPLFAFFIGVTLANGQYENLHNWSVYDLLDNLLKREKNEFWAKHKAYEQAEPKYHENLLALTTLTQGLSEDDVCDLCGRIADNGKWLPEEPSLELYSRMASIRQDEEMGKTIWEGMQPDLLGEYFLLSRMEDWMQESLIKGKKAATALIQTAWEISPKETGDFIVKTLLDYEELSDKKAYKLLFQTRPLLKAPIEAWSEWGLLLVGLTARPLISTGALVSPVGYYDILKQEYELQTEKNIRELLLFRQAQATLNLTGYFGKEGNLTQAKDYYGKLVDLLGRFPDNKYIALLQAQAAFNLINDFAKKEGFAQAEHYYRQIMNLLDRFPDNQDIAIEQAKAAVNLTNFFGRKGAFTQAAYYYGHIETLFNRFPDNQSIALLQANAAVNLILYFDETVEPVQAEYYYEQIVTLLSRFLDYQNLAFAQAQATLNISLYFSRREELEKVESYYLKFEALLERFPNNQNIAFVQAEAATNLIVYFGKINLGYAGHYYNQIVTLAGKFPDNQNLAIVQAKAAVNMGYFFGGKGEFTQAVHFHGKIVNLLDRYPENHEIAIEQAKSALTMTDFFGRKRKIGQAEPYYYQTEALLNRFPTNHYIAYLQAQASFNLIVYSFNEGKLAQAEHYYRQIMNLLDRFPDNQDIAIEQAKAALNFTNLFRKIDKAEPYYRQIVDLLGRFSNNQYIAFLQAQAAFNLTNSYGEKGAYGKAEESYDQIVDLLKRFPDNQLIAIEQAKASVNLTSFFGRKREFGKAERFYREIVDLVGRFLDHPNLALRQAQAAYNLFTSFNDEKNLVKTEEYYGQVKILYLKFPEDQEISNIYHDIRKKFK